MKNWFGNLNMIMTLRMVAGKRLPELDSAGVGCREAFKAFFNMATIPLISDSLPYLRWLDVSEHKKATREAAK
ncbi:Flavonoid-6-hydroxylase-like protein [Drosera capensis]